MRRLLALAVPLLLLACGGGDDADDAVTVDASPDGLARAASRTIDGESGRFAAELTIGGGPQEVEMAFTGAYDAAGRSEVEIDLGAMLGQLPEGAVPPGFDEPLRIVMDGETMFLCGAFVAAIASGSDCGSVDLADAGIPTVSGPADPTAFLRTLAGSDDVEEVGAEDVDGVATTHFQGSYTLRDAIDALEPAQADRLTEQLDGLGASADTMLDLVTPFDAWVDGEGRVRRIAIDMALPVETPTPGSLRMDMRFTDFGEDLTIEVPTDAADLTELLGNLGG